MFTVYKCFSAVFREKLWFSRTICRCPFMLKSVCNQLFVLVRAEVTLSRAFCYAMNAMGYA